MSSEKSFRPQTIDDLKGQPRVQKQLKIYIKASQMKHETLDHVLIMGNSGSGKSTCAGIIAHELGVGMKTYSGPSITNTDDMAEILMGIKEGDVIFIDEVHRLNKKIQEMLFFALENFKADLSVDGAPQRIDLPRFTCICATDRYGSLVEAFSNRFPIQLRLESYSEKSITKIIKQSAQHAGINLDDECASMIARTTRGVPHNANSNLRRISDYALVTNDGKITPDTVEEALDLMGVNKYGLNLDDMKYLTYLANSVKAVGIDTLVVSTGMDKGSWSRR